jgi:hypothetical protein
MNMNESTMATIQYLEQFVITDVSKLVIVVGVCAIILGIILLLNRKE